MKATAILATFVVAASYACTAPGASPAAISLVKSAESAAHKEHKNVLLIFHASWCGWCHRLDGFLTDPKIAPLINSSYEIVHVDVLEQPDKKEIENTGGEDMMAQMGGKDAGLPYFVILSPNNKVLATSMKDATATAKPQNIGYPGEPDEIAHFMDMIKKTSNLPEGKQNSIRDFLIAHKPS